VPAYEAAKLVLPLAVDVANALEAIVYPPLATVSAAYRRADVQHPLDGFGFLAPRVESPPVLVELLVDEPPVLVDVPPDPPLEILPLDVELMLTITPLDPVVPDDVVPEEVVPDEVVPDDAAPDEPLDPVLVLEVDEITIPPPPPMPPPPPKKPPAKNPPPPPNPPLPPTRIGLPPPPLLDTTGNSPLEPR
jgi:hypothetical protein